MKLKDLKNEVCSLCFMRPEEVGVGFINAVRRALSIIFCELKITGKKSMTISKNRICKSEENISHIGKSDLTLPLVGRAYSVKLSGKGSFTVYDGPILKTESFDADEICFKGFIKYGGEIKFKGDYSYTVLSLTTFSDISSDRLEDIPDDSAYIVDMNRYPDFFSFSAPPTDIMKNEIKGIVTDGTKIIFPVDFSGKATVYYRKRPLPLIDDDEEYINLPDGYLTLLAPLTSAMILVDDDKNLSDCYMELYSRMAKSMKPTLSEATQVRTNGWA